MVKFDFVFNNGKIIVETVDDAESTPGASRQYTRFNNECKPELEKLGAEYDQNDPKFTDKILGVLAEHMFEKCKVEQIKDEKGNPTNRARFWLETVDN